MIASHNTLSFYSPKNKIYNCFKFLWKCQKDYYAAITEADYLDIRVRYDSNTKKWIACHGIVDFDIEFESFFGIVSFIHTRNKIGRIIIERGNYPRTSVDAAIAMLKWENNKHIHSIIIKKGWKHLYNNKNINFKIADCCYKYWNPDNTKYSNILHLLTHFNTIKGFAKKIAKNGHIGSYERCDKDIVYFVDYVNYFI